MKKTFFVFILSFAALTFFSCAGDTGPAGPEGNAGDDGDIKVVFQQGVYPSAAYTGCEDAYIEAGGNQEMNYGGCDELNAGYYQVISRKRRSFIKFDLSYITPANVNVTAAYLKLSFSSSPDIQGTTTITAYAAAKNWQEGGAPCTGTADVGVSWADYDGSNTWDTAGGDYSAVACSDTKEISGSPYDFTLTITADTVESWINDPSANYGMILKASNESSPGVDNYIRPASSEHATSGVRPELTIYYSLPE